MATATAERLVSMLKVVFEDGYVLEGESYEELATRLWSGSFSNDASVQDYMQGMIRRAKMWTGQDISFTDYESFFSELHRVGITSPVEDTSK